MALVKKVTKIGNSWGVIFSSEMMNLSGIKPGSECEVEVAPYEIRLRLSQTGDNLKDHRVASAMSHFIKKYRQDLKKLAS